MTVFENYPWKNWIVIGIAESSCTEVIEKHHVVKVGQISTGPHLHNGPEKIFSQNLSFFGISEDDTVQ